MTTKVKISIVETGIKKTTTLICDEKEIAITFEPNQGELKTYKSTNFYKAFGILREENKNITFLCKGSKINVHPSSMASQMSLGLKAYELNLGKDALLEDLVNIFDYEDQTLTNDPNEQRDFYLKWIKTETTD